MKFNLAWIDQEKRSSLKNDNETKWSWATELGIKLLWKDVSEVKYYSNIPYKPYLSMGAWRLYHGQKPPHHPNGEFCMTNYRPCPRIHQDTEQLSLISVEMSRDGKAKPSGQSLGDMFAYAKAYMIPRLMIEFWTLLKPGPSTKSWAQP